MFSNIQNLIIINIGKYLKISKNKFSRYGGQVGSCTSVKNISTIWNVGQFDIGQLGYEISLVQHCESSKHLDK